MFPFGHGLSYTKFQLSDVRATPQDDGVRVTALLTNTGQRAGSTVVQVYIGEDTPPVPRPMHELKGFAKAHLAPGEAREINIDLCPRDFAWFDTARQAWVVTGGDYTIHAGFSAGDLQAVLRISRTPDQLSV
jgi:beta-glucosidase